MTITGGQTFQGDASISSQPVNIPFTCSPKLNDDALTIWGPQCKICFTFLDQPSCGAAIQVVYPSEPFLARGDVGDARAVGR